MVIDQRQNGRAAPHASRRREFMILLGGTAIAWPFTVRAQRKADMSLVGWLGTTPEAPALRGFGQGLREIGYVERQNIMIEYRFPLGQIERYADQVDELIRLKPDVLVTDGFPATNAVRRASLTVPVVFISADPVGSGFVKSLAHPDANMTGLSLAVEAQFSGKWLELLKETVPQITRVAYLWNSINHSSASSWATMQSLAPAIGMRLSSVEVQAPDHIEAALTQIIRNHDEGIIVDSDAIVGLAQTRIIEFAAVNRLPAISVLRRYVDAGGLMSYGPSLYDLGRRAAGYVGKILKGARPTDLPVEQPTKFELVINLKTAKTLGLTVPQSILARAEEVIE